MQKTLNEQLSCKCKHFTGIMSKVCQAGVKYADVILPGMKIPCLNTGGNDCPKREFLTTAEVQEELKRIEEFGNRGLAAITLIRKHMKETGAEWGTVECMCGSFIKYTVAGNGHIRAKCSGCGVSFME